MIYAYAASIYADVLGEGDFRDDTFFDLIADPRKLAKPHKNTLLHSVISNIVNYYNESVMDLDEEAMVAEGRAILTEGSITIPSWLTTQHVADHRGELSILFTQAVDAIVPSVFFILFSDRQFLFAFQRRVSDYVRTLRYCDYPGILRRDGMLRRSNIPTWLKAAVFYRDRGRCQHCQKDLTGLMRAVRDLQIDHIIPLNRSGSNDPTNFQLLCAKCNRKKHTTLKHRRPLFEAYW
jgi:hypothetical protein